MLTYLEGDLAVKAYHMVTKYLVSTFFIYILFYLLCSPDVLIILNETGCALSLSSDLQIALSPPHCLTFASDSHKVLLFLQC